MDEPTCRCHQNPFIGALGIQQPVILGEPQICEVEEDTAHWKGKEERRAVSPKV